MQAIIMAAGQGTRLRPLTDHQPKCLVKVAGRPILDRILDELPDYIDEVVVVIGYLGHLVREHLKNYTKHKLVFVEVEPFGTGYAVKACEKYIKGNFLALNGDDLYHKSDLDKLQNYELAFLVKEVGGATRFGHIVTDSLGNFVDIQPGQPNQENLGYIGAVMLTTDYFKWPLAKTKSGEYGLPHTLLEQAKAGVKFKVLEAVYWFPIGYPQDVANAESYLNTINRS